MAGVVNKERLILGFHKLEGDFFHRLVHDLGQDPTNMRWVIAFWLWLESVGHHDFVRRAYALPGPVVLRFVEEAVVCLRCLAGEGQDGTDSRVTSLPCTNAFLAEPIDDVGYFVERRKKILKGVNYMYRTVCLVACVGNNAGDTGGARAAAPLPPRTSSPGEMMSSPRRTAPASLMMSSPRRSSPAPLMMNNSPRRSAPSPLMMNNSPARSAPPPQMMNTPHHGAPPLLLMNSPHHGAPPSLMVNSPAYGAQLMVNSPEEHAAPLMMMSSPGYGAPLMMSLPGPGAPLIMGTPYHLSMAPALNPMASPWVPPMPEQSTLPEDYRSLFVTFSKGYPVSREDIMDFFNSMFGPCVEAVTLENVQPGETPVYGRVVLCSEAMIPVVLEGQQMAKFLIKGRHLWARVYFPSTKPPLYA